MAETRTCSNCRSWSALHRGPDRKERPSALCLSTFSINYRQIRHAGQTCSAFYAGPAIDLQQANEAQASEIAGIVIVHTTKDDPNPTYHVIGDAVRLFFVDEKAPSDRVFEWLRRSPQSVFRKLIPEGSEIGSCQDDRHEAVANRINAALDGRAPFSIVGEDDNA